MSIPTEASERYFEEVNALKRWYDAEEERILKKTPYIGVKDVQREQAIGKLRRQLAEELMALGHQYQRPDPPSPFEGDIDKLEKMLKEKR